MAEDTTKRMQALLGALASDSVSPRVASLLRPLVVGTRWAAPAPLAVTPDYGGLTGPIACTARRIKAAPPPPAVREARYKAALDLHVPIMTMHYAESGTWIVGLKRLLGLSADLASKS